MKIKFVHYVGMVFVATEMPQDKPVMCGVVTQTGEMRAWWRDTDYRGDDKMYLEFDIEIGKAMITGEIPMPIYAFIHPDNEQSNKATAKMGLQMEKVIRGGVEWNDWYLSDERVKAIMEFRRRYLSATSNEERQGVLDDYVKNFGTVIKDKIKSEGVKVK
jgi:hypothetical protein